MYTGSNSDISIDFTQVLPCESDVWLTTAHQLRWIETKIATQPSVQNTIARYRRAGMDLHLQQAPNNLWYLGELRGPILLKKIFPNLELDFRLYILFMLCKQLRKFHSFDLTHGGIDTLSVSLGTDGSVYLHGIKPSVQISKDEEIKKFAQYVSRQLAIHTPNMTTKQHTLLTASSLRVLLNEGCAGNLPAPGGLELLIQSFSLLLPSTPSILQRRLAHALSNHPPSNTLNKLSIRLDRQLSKRTYPKTEKATTEEQVPVPKVRTQPNNTPSLKEPVQRERISPVAEPRKPIEIIKSTPKPKEIIVQQKEQPKRISPTNEDSKSISKVKFLYPETQKTNPLYIFLAISATLGIVLITLSQLNNDQVTAETNPPLEPKVLIQNTNTQESPETQRQEAQETQEDSLPQKSAEREEQTAELKTPNPPAKIETSQVKSRAPKKRVKKTQVPTIPTKPTQSPLAIQEAEKAPLVESPQSELTIETNSVPQNTSDELPQQLESKAQLGQLTLDETIQLQEVSVNDPLYTNNQTLLLINAQAQDNQRQIKQIVRALMVLPENNQNPHILLAAAHSALHEEDFTEALILLQRARNHISLPAEVNYNGQWHEIFAATLTGLYIVQAPNTSLSETIEAWNEVYSLANEYNQPERSLRAQKMIETLTGDTE